MLERSDREIVQSDIDDPRFCPMPYALASNLVSVLAPRCP